jgi:hypothetical protein
MDAVGRRHDEVVNMMARAAQPKAADKMRAPIFLFNHRHGMRHMTQLINWIPAADLGMAPEVLRLFLIGHLTYCSNRSARR